MNDHEEVEAIHKQPTDQPRFPIETLIDVLRDMLGADIVTADYQIEQLHGGTLGDVKLVSGAAVAADGGELPYRVVWKAQKKWARHGDPDSWRREYDLYQTALGSYFPDPIRWPKCYHSQIGADEIQLWIEYLDGATGSALTVDMYERAAYALGRFQGKLYAEQPAELRGLQNLSPVDFAKSFYLHYKSWDVVYDYIRSDTCEIPRHLCQMLIDLDENAERIFERIGKLPVVFCHRDFWIANIFYSDGQVGLIDWDTTGWGPLGEDIAALIADEADVDHMAEIYRRAIPAYYKGFADFADAPPLSEHCIHEFILLLFGYRIIEWFKFAETPEDKALQIQTLEAIHSCQSIIHNS